MEPGRFRLLLASVVVLHHYSHIALGNAAVLLFFALSGYWIQTMWVKTYSKSRRPYITFLTSRLWRLLPVFLLCSTLALFLVVALPLFWPPRVGFPPLGYDTLFSSFFLLGYSEASYQPLVPAWSIDIELQFYILAPLIIVALDRRFRLTAFALLVVNLLSLDPFIGARHLGAFIIFFFVGMSTARGMMLSLYRPPMVRVSCAGVIILLSLAALAPDLRGPVYQGDGSEMILGYRVIDLFSALVAVAALPLALSTVFRPTNATDRLMADISYSLYLVHWLPLIVLTHFLPDLHALSTGFRLAALSSILFLVYSISTAVTLWFDRPLSAKRNRYVQLRVAREIGGAAS
jgi:peptidoglycan/LPS O-acetylase OafA/YrhL